MVVIMVVIVMRAMIMAVRMIVMTHGVAPCGFFM
jgi:hypothetical protein